MNHVRIENWFISSTSSPFKAPEVSNRVICGEVYGHPKFDDGHKITSSGLITIDLRGGYVLSKNTRFELGSINREYLSAMKKRTEQYDGLELYEKPSVEAIFKALGANKSYSVRNNE